MYKKIQLKVANDLEKNSILKYLNSMIKKVAIGLKKHLSSS